MSAYGRITCPTVVGWLCEPFQCLRCGFYELGVAEYVPSGMGMVTDLRAFFSKVPFLGEVFTTGLTVVSTKAHILIKAGGLIQHQVANVMGMACDGGLVGIAMKVNGLMTRWRVLVS